jgi:hypothetical protein
MEKLLSLKHSLIDLFAEMAWKMRDKSLDFRIGQEVVADNQKAVVQNYFGWGMWEVKFANDERDHLDLGPSTYIFEYKDLKTV